MFNESHKIIKKNSDEYQDFIQMLKFISYKANREVLCTKCWQLLSTKQKIKHLKLKPNHGSFILTSSYYSSESKIIELAIANDKVFLNEEGDEYIYSPVLKSGGKVLHIEEKINRIQ